jgi:hypothetical protein
MKRTRSVGHPARWVFLGELDHPVGYLAGVDGLEAKDRHEEHRQSSLRAEHAQHEVVKLAPPSMAASLPLPAWRCGSQ